MANNDVAIIEVKFNDSGPEMVSLRRNSLPVDQKTPDSDKQFSSSNRFMAQSFISTTNFYENNQHFKDNIQIKINELRQRPSQDEDVIYEKENVTYCQSKNPVENKVERAEFLSIEEPKKEIELKKRNKLKKKHADCGFNYLLENLTKIYRRLFKK